MWICIAPCREHTCNALRYGTRSQGISQLYLHTLHSSANGMNHTWDHFRMGGKHWYQLCCIWWIITCTTAPALSDFTFL